LIDHYVTWVSIFELNNLFVHDNRYLVHSEGFLKEEGGLFLLGPTSGPLCQQREIPMVGFPQYLPFLM